MHPERPYLTNFDPALAPSPCFVIDLDAIDRNARMLAHVAQSSGAKILLALKGFACSATFPILSSHLFGVCASSPHEARLGREKFGKEVHGFAPAFTESNFQEFLEYSDHMVFNSLSQWERFRGQLAKSPRHISHGLRVNPEYSEAHVEMYDPCAKGSRLGVPARALTKELVSNFDGLHFHCLCEQGAEVLERTLEVFERDFSPFFAGLKWLNFGGGHHITQPDYNVPLLIDLLTKWKKKYGLQIYLEPGEAVAIHSGALITTVLDVVDYGDPIAILDISATCHMPDILEMPYRPEITHAGRYSEKAYSYNLGGLSCLAGDIIGRYSFDQPLSIGDRLIFEDMSHYTMVKTTNFNGIHLPSIATWSSRNASFRVEKGFDYETYASRLA